MNSPPRRGDAECLREFVNGKSRSTSAEGAEVRGAVADAQGICV